MGKSHLILLGFFAVPILCGYDNNKCWSEGGSTRCADDRPSQQICPNNYRYKTLVPEASKQLNYGCICQYTGPPGNANNERAPNFSACGTYGQCVNGKCFHNTCVNRCYYLAENGEVTLTNIRIDKSSRLVYCESYGKDINKRPYYADVECELPSQSDFNGRENDQPANRDTTDLILPFAVENPDLDCQTKFKDSRPTASARNWNNGCYYRCVVNGELRIERNVQPYGTACATDSICLSAKCQRRICVNSCQSSATINGFNLLDLIQEDNRNDKVDCYFQGRTVLVTTTLPSPLKCEVRKTDEKPVSDNSTASFGNVNGTLNSGGNINSPNSGNNLTQSNLNINNNNNTQTGNNSSMIFGYPNEEDDQKKTTQGVNTTTRVP